GIMAQELAGGNEVLALLCSMASVGAVLFVIITIFVSVSGAHFNPAVSLVMWLRGNSIARKPLPISACRSLEVASAPSSRI
ncbi:unnamed protein product, partial [marine sediment metagenome]